MEKSLRATLKNGKFEGTSAVRSRQMAAVKSRGNKTTELALRMALVRAGVAGWKTNVKAIAGKPDFYFANSKLAVFVDGCFWHGCPNCSHIPKSNTGYWAQKFIRNAERDKKVMARLVSEGIRSVRFWEHELRDMKSVVNTLNTALHSDPSLQEIGKIIT